LPAADPERLPVRRQKSPLSTSWCGLKCKVRRPDKISNNEPTKMPGTSRIGEVGFSLVNIGGGIIPVPLVGDALAEFDDHVVRLHLEKRTKAWFEWSDTRDSDLSM
jgi:hypothetical protein